MVLLDIIIDPDRRPRRPILPDTVVPNKPVEVLPDTTDTVTTANDTVSALVGNIGSAGGSDDLSLLLWSVLAVVFVLGICLYFVKLYRQRLPQTSMKI